MIANSPEKSANYLVGGVDAAAETTHVRRPQRIEARWRSGDVEDCKSSHPGSIPGQASNFFPPASALAIAAPIARLPAASGRTAGLQRPAVNRIRT